MTRLDLTFGDSRDEIQVGCPASLELSHQCGGRRLHSPVSAEVKKERRGEETVPPRLPAQLRNAPSGERKGLHSTSSPTEEAKSTERSRTNSSPLNRRSRETPALRQTPERKLPESPGPTQRRSFRSRLGARSSASYSRKAGRGLRASQQAPLEI